MTDTILDARGLKCPLPVLRARKQMKTIPSGEVLKVLATDRDAVKDFTAFCETTGHALEEWREEDGVFTFRIRKAA